jgi:DNA-binding sugar fermentation-stimulating protein
MTFTCCNSCVNKIDCTNFKMCKLFDEIYDDNYYKINYKFVNCNSCVNKIDCDNIKMCKLFDEIYDDNYKI